MNIMKAPTSTKVPKNLQQNGETEIDKYKNDVNASSTEPKISENKNLVSNNGNSDSNANATYIKTSLSMTSLPPNEQQECSEIIKAKLRLERPYNSLKKKRQDRDSWRNSWGSGHSHSSCSLHSNANSALSSVIGGGGGSSTSTGINNGKDEFWAALQTNYNYIMDTNLLDSCKEARCEIEGAANISTNKLDCCNMMLQSRRDEGIFDDDPRELRKWLREMENRLSIVPSLSEATQMSTEELQNRLQEHSVLYCEIVSHARVVGACIKASERENSNENTFNSLSSEEKTPIIKNKFNTASNKITELTTNNITTATVTATATQLPFVNQKKTDGNLKGLERRYHLLYLKAIEVQCLFEGLLKKKNSANVLSQESSSNELLTDSDDEPALKLARYSDSECNTHASLGILSNYQETTTTTDDNKSEDHVFNDDHVDLHRLIKINDNLSQTEEFIVLDHDEIDCSLTTITPDNNNAITTTTIDEKNLFNWNDIKFNCISNNINLETAEFDADSEGSDIDEKFKKKLFNQRRPKRIISLNPSKSLTKSTTTKVCLLTVQNIDKKNLNENINIKNMETNNKLNISSAIIPANTNNNPNLISKTLSTITSISELKSFLNNSNQDNVQLNRCSSTTTTTQKILQKPLTEQVNGNVTTTGTILNETDGLVKKRQRKNGDVSKFNRSNRKSKNCATFYFKHTDTDNETNFGLSSNGSEALKSNSESIEAEDDDEYYIDNDDVDDDDDDEDEGWLYNDVKHIQDNQIILQNDDSDKENKIELIKEQQNNLYITIAGEQEKSSAINCRELATSNNNSNNKNSVVEDNNSVILIKDNNGNIQSPSLYLQNNDLSTSTISTSSRSITEITTKTAINCAEIIIKEDCNDDYMNGNNIITNFKELNLNENHKIPITTTITREEELKQNNISSSVTTISIANPLNDNNTAESKEMFLTKANDDKFPQTTNMDEISKESIKKLVLDAENLVRDEILLKTPTKSNNRKNKKQIIVKLSSTVKKRELMPGTNFQRVQEWLEHQPVSPKKDNLPISVPTTDCEASAENTESSAPERDSSDSSEEFTDSVATYMQTCSTSHGTSTEIIGTMNGGSAEPLPTYIGSNQSINSTSKVIRRSSTQQRRNSERPWSVSCLSQLTTGVEAAVINPILNEHQGQNGLATHSISESAINILSSPSRNKTNNGNCKGSAPVKNSDSRSSLKRRKTRRKKLSSSNGKRSDSGSENFVTKSSQTLLNSEKLSTEKINGLQDLTDAFSLISCTNYNKRNSDLESEEEEQNLMKPNFKVGSLITIPHIIGGNDVKLGPLAALANYQLHEDGASTPEPRGTAECQTGTDEHNSSFSEQAWDDYQEKYNSENYSEGFDSDAARRILEFGDDYRQFLDSQSDCCSSLSAANNIDSLSPPRMDSLKQTELKLTPEAITSTVDHVRRRRALELEYERRRRNLEMKRKSSQDNIHNQHILSSPSNVQNNTIITPKNLDYNLHLNRAIGGNSDSATRRLEFTQSSSSQQSLKKLTSESDTSSKRAAVSSLRRRQSRNIDKGLKPIPITTSSSNTEDSEDEKEMDYLLQQSRKRLDDTKALKIRSHLLRPEDYAEIIATCRDNIRCLEAVLRGPPSTVLSSTQANETKDILLSWESLLQWSENNGAARKMQEDMIILKNSLKQLGCKLSTNKFDSDISIQYAIEELMNEKSELQSYRTNMLRLNASVHSWLTRQEMKLKTELEQIQKYEEEKIQQNNDNDNNETIINEEQTEKCIQINSILHSESELHKHLKDEVSEMYKAWDEANARIINQLETLNASLNAWRQLEFGLTEFYQVLGKDRGTLQGLEGALENGINASNTELARNVKLVAKLLSEKFECVSDQVIIQNEDGQQYLNPQHISYIAKFKASNGSLSDSGISDGATSDGGLSERERRLGVLRRLAKQLENALAPGSDALKSIAARMEAAEAELKTLQNTCRDLIVRTAVSQQQKNIGKLSSSDTNHLHINAKLNSKLNDSPKRNKNKLRSKIIANNSNENSDTENTRKFNKLVKDNSGDPDDPNNSDIDALDSDDEDSSKNKRRGWSWRVARIALPMQIALFAVFCAACLMQPNCCDSMNNLSMSFTPQLRYVNGPPPI